MSTLMKLIRKIEFIRLSILLLLTIEDDKTPSLFIKLFQNVTKDFSLIKARNKFCIKYD